MASGDKTEEATPQQLKKARERGEVSQSKELTGAMVLAAGFMVLSSQMDIVGATFKNVLRGCFTIAVTRELSPGLLLEILGRSVLTGLLSVSGAIIGMTVMAFFIPFLQVGALITFEPLMPQMKRVNPLSGFKRIFLSKNTYIELLKGIVKITIVGWLCWGVISGELRNVVFLSTQPPPVIAHLTSNMVAAVVKRVLMCFLGLAVLDVFWQKHNYKQQYKMSKEEVKQEYKEQEGDPQHKAHRNRLHQELASENMLQQARKANVIVTNPDHIACALRYDPDEEEAPRLLAKGQGWMAEKIKEIAREEDIPIVRDVSLAHALYQMDLDEQIPEELFDAVSEVLKWVEVLAKSEGKTPAWRKPRQEPQV